MDGSVFAVTATAGTLRAAEGVLLRHTWTEEEHARLLAVLHEVAEIPRALRAGTTVTRMG